MNASVWFEKIFFFFNVSIFPFFILLRKWKKKKVSGHPPYNCR